MASAKSFRSNRGPFGYSSASMFCVNFVIFLVVLNSNVLSGLCDSRVNRQVEITTVSDMPDQTTEAAIKDTVSTPQPNQNGTTSAPIVPTTETTTLPPISDSTSSTDSAPNTNLSTTTPSATTTTEAVTSTTLSPGSSTEGSSTAAPSSTTPKSTASALALNLSFLFVVFALVIC